MEVKVQENYRLEREQYERNGNSLYIIKSSSQYQYQSKEERTRED